MGENFCLIFSKVFAKYKILDVVVDYYSRKNYAEENEDMYLFGEGNKKVYSRGFFECSYFAVVLLLLLLSRHHTPETNGAKCAYFRSSYHYCKQKFRAICLIGTNFLRYVLIRQQLVSFKFINTHVSIRIFFLSIERRMLFKT